MKNQSERRQVLVVTIFNKGVFMDNLVFSDAETGEKVVAAMQALFNPQGHKDISFKAKFRTVYDIATIKKELSAVTKNEDVTPEMIGDIEDAGQYDTSFPTVDLDALLVWERNMAGLPEKIELSQIMGLWQLGNSYWYDPERRAWDGPISILPANIRIRFREEGTEEEYEGEIITGRSSYLYDSKRRTLIWEGNEHYVVSLSPTCMEVIIYEPEAENRPYEEIYKLVYNRIK